MYNLLPLGGFAELSSLILAHMGSSPMRAKLSCKLLKNGGINLSKTISILEGEINVTTRI
jgi:hypothetical protein